MAPELSDVDRDVALHVAQADVARAVGEDVHAAADALISISPELSTLISTSPCTSLDLDVA